MNPQQEQDLEKLTGIVERVTFHNTDNGWSVLRVSPFNEPHKLATVVVHQARVFAGASMEFLGVWTNHPRFGEQFKAAQVTEKKPASAAAMEKYLGSGMIKGVGPKIAQKIIRHFKDRTLEVFESQIDELLEVPGIAHKKLDDIKSSWAQHRAIRDVMMFLQGYGISTLFAVKIYKAYGDRSIKTVSANPYCLAQDIYGIGFFSADRIALNMGLSTDGLPRIGAGIRHVLQASRDDGHCFLTEDQIIENTEELLTINNAALIHEVLGQLLQTNEIKKRALPQETGSAIECYYSNSLYFDEAYVAKKIKQLTQARIEVDQARVSSWIDKYCKQYEMDLSPEQRASVEGIAQHSFSILTGGPGCGKTTSTKVLFRLLQAMRKKVILAAPTGRAAQRMTEVIGAEAKTIHRLLEWSPGESGFKRQESDPLRADFLIIDECSMLDISLAAALFKAVPLTCQVLFIGDPDQLPSVGAGNVLHDLLSVKSVPHFRLTQVFRQAAQSLIIQYAHQINRGEVPRIASPLAKPQLWKDRTDCLFIDSEEVTQEQLRFLRRARQAISATLNEAATHLLQTGEQIWGQMVRTEDTVRINELYVPVHDADVQAPVLVVPEKFRHVDLEQLSRSSDEIDELKQILTKIHPWSSLHYGFTALDTIVRLYSKTIPEFYGKSCEIQILTPQVRGTLGTLSLNRQIQEAVNPERLGRRQITIGEKVFREGDRIIQTRNNYDLGVFNGDIGNIQSINLENYTCSICFASTGEVVTYEKEDLTELALAYAVTIHKSQGSEFEAVIVPVTSQHFKMLFRNLIYTGLTRAKKLAVFVGSRKALAMAVRSIDSRERQTALSYLVSPR